MHNIINNIILTRKFILSICEPLTEEQLNTTPNGFNNNIIWNLGHLIAAQQGICYIRSGLNPVVDESITEYFKSGSKPNKIFNNNEIESIKKTFTASLEQLKNDIEKNLFVNYEPLQTRYGVTISNITEAIQFLPFHEGLHAGTINAMKRLVALHESAINDLH